jgi:uncharacterized protein
MVRQTRGRAANIADQMLADGHNSQKRAIIVKPVGEGCNYRCTYCYHHDILEHLERMSLDELAAIYRAVQRAQGTNVRLYWHGGEPTLAGLPFFEAAIQLQYEIFGERLDNVIQTNGSLLDDDWVAYFNRHRFGIGISLDGGRNAHDAYRRSAGDRGTFDATLAGMHRLRDAGLAFGIIAVATRGNLDPLGLYQAACGAGAAQLSTNPATSPADVSPSARRHGSLPSDIAPTPLEYGRFVVDLIELWLEAGGTGPDVRHVSDFLGGLVGMWQPTCRLNGSCSYFVNIRKDGTVKGCCDRSTDPQDHPQTYFGNLHQIGFDGIVSSDRFRSFRQKADRNPPSCEGCQWLGMCRGGCSHVRLMYGGSLDAHDPYCESYKLIFSYLQSVIDRLD